MIRNKRIVDDYTKGASAEERAVLDDTEVEAQLTKKWILSINQQTELVSKTLTTDFNSPELSLLHKMQSKFLHQYMDLSQVYCLHCTVDMNDTNQSALELKMPKLNTHS